MILRDLRLAARSLRRSPGFSLIAVLTLALGLGANAAIFGVLDAALFRPLPFPRADRLVTLQITVRRPGTQDAESFPWSWPKYDLFRKNQTSLSATAGFSSASLNLQEGETPERLQAEEVGAAYFDVLGLRPATGRLFRSGEDATPGQPEIVVLGHGLWQRRFGSDPSIVGRQLRFNGRSLTVVGVAPAGFHGLTGNADVFIPMSLVPYFEYPEILSEAGNHWFLAVGRLRDGVTAAAAALEADRVGAEVDRRYRFPEQTGIWSSTVSPLAESRVDPGFRRSIVLLSGAVGLVLLIGCVNLTSLLLVRAVARRRELAVRLALGASRARVVRQVLAETLALSAAGGIVGLGLAGLGVRLLRALGGGWQPQGDDLALFDPSGVSVNGRVMLFAAAMVLLAALLVALVPAIQASRPSVTESLKSGGRAGSSGHLSLRRPGAQQFLVMGEVALALMLLVGAGLLIRSFARLQAVDVGFRPDHLLTFRYAAADGDRAGRDSRGFKEALTTRLAALPGVEGAAVTLCAPLSGPCATSVVLRRDAERFGPGSGAVEIGVQNVTPDFFRTLGVPIVRGRGFTAADRQGAPRVVVVNETAAKRLWPGQDPIGHRLAAATSGFAGGDSTAEVVGVARDVPYGAIGSAPVPDVYLPAYQSGGGSIGVVFLRTRGDPLALVETARREVRAVDPNLPIFAVNSMEGRAHAALARPRFATTLLGVFAGLALLLAAVGLYGVMAFSVAQRTREIGLRMALGAEAGLVLRGVLRQGLVLAGAGIALGLAGALALQRVMTGLLYGVGSTDPLTLAGVSLLMGFAAAAAAFIPARRATRVDPMEALRAE